MKKASLIIMLSVLFLFSFTGCNGEQFYFTESVEEIESIEIVSASNSLEFMVLKTLSEAETKDFLARFQRMKFYKYWGDPPRLHGDGIRITYKSGVYEMICAYTVEYVEDGKIQFRWRRCNETELNELLHRFLK